MQVTIDRNGVMTVRAESPLESYALKHWVEENEFKTEDGTLCVGTEVLVFEWDGEQP